MFKNYRTVINVLLVFILVGLSSSQVIEPIDPRIKQIDPKKAAEMTKAIEATVNPQLELGLTMKLWAMDSLVYDPVSISIDNNGNAYYTRTNRQKNSEFDIRQHADWETESIQLQSVEEKRAFLHRVLAPENSDKNKWLEDVNKDNSHDWKDMTVQKENVYSVSDIDGDGIADRTQLILEDFHDETTDAMGGILKYGDDLFVDLAPDTWRLRDTNGDGFIDEKTSISHGYGIHVGFSGHGMSGLEVGPEGKIYWQIGDIGFSGTDADGKKWEYPNSGVIVRSNPDGSDFEVFAYGNRNTHEFVFDEYGNLIGEDNDGDQPGERERLIYVVDGADFGWRINWQFGKYKDPLNNTYRVWMDEKMAIPRWDGQPAYIIPTIENFVNGPTGMVYNPGTALSAKWKNTFFIVEFPGFAARAGIYSFKLKPKGATFALGENKKIVGNVLATGLDFGPDGAMYAADWINGWKTKDLGRIWKIDDEGANLEIRKQVQTLLASNFSSLDNDKLGSLLKHEDMRVRQKAQFELANRGKDGIEQFSKNIAQKEFQLARVNSIWGISQFARKDIKNAKLLLPLLKDSDPEIRAQAAKWIGDVRFKDAGQSLLPLLKDEYSRARFFAAEALGRIAYEPAVTSLIELLRTNNDVDEYIRHAASLALSRINKAEPLRALHTDPSRAVRIGAVLALRRMKHEAIAEFLKDKDEFVVTEAARGINDDLSIEKALPALGDALNNYSFTSEALIRRAINANLRVGSDKSIGNLVAYAAHEGSPVAMRAEAIATLSTWAKPSVLDRVDGRYRGSVARYPEFVKSKTSPTFIALLSNKEKTIQLATMKALGKMNINAASPQLFMILKNAEDASLRIEALNALSQMNDPKIGDAISIALVDKDKSVRVVGLDLLPKTSLSKETIVAMLSNVIETQPIEEKQAALSTLGRLPIQNVKPEFEKLLTNMESGKLPKEVYLELGEAIDSVRATDLKSRYDKITANSSKDSELAAYEGALLGGDAERGQNIFFKSQNAQCIRCHSIHDTGGAVGPQLDGVAARISRQEILEALVDPSKRIAPGFGTVELALKNGKTVNGILKEEKSNALLLKRGDKADTLINKAQILKRTEAPSSMPVMRYLLTKKEIRDVVSYLSTLK